MARFLIIVTFLGVIGGGMYFILSRETEEDVEVTGKIEFSQQPCLSKEDAKGIELINYAIVRGTIKNNLKKALSNIFIKYSIEGNQSSATVFDLAPGQQVEFITRMIQTSAEKPEFSYEGVQYDENSL